jgi:hypothetical protein
LPFNLDLREVDINFMLIITILYFSFFLKVLRKVDSIKSQNQIYLFGIVSIILSNLIQGIKNGLSYPIVGGNNDQYYGEAVRISDSYTFITNYNHIQFELMCHSATHPPGATLVYYYMNKVLASPEFISIMLMLVSLTIIYYIYIN